MRKVVSPTRFQKLKMFWKSSQQDFPAVFRKHKKLLFYVMLACFAVLLLIPPVTYLYFARDISDKERILNRSKTGLTLLDRDGEAFFTFYQPKKITYIPLSEISTSLKEAVIASEDKNFYTNPGFSVRGIARAFLNNIFAGRIVEGGSTITQELVKNSLLSSSRTYLRKYQEIVLAAELNRRYSKNDVLEMYLNSVYFGEGAFGIENAAQAYFGVRAKDLTLSQSAVLVGLLPAPSAYSPLSNEPSIARKRQAIVLNEMVEERYITRQEADEVIETPLKYSPAAESDINILAPHFAIYVKDKLIEKYGEERVIRDGFKVRTTLKSSWQRYAQNAVKNQVANLRFNKVSNGAAVVMDPDSGEIQAMVGSYDWDDEDFGKLNMTIAPRQPGSAFKPIIYAKAIEKRLVTAATILEDKPVTFNGNYKPKNYDNRYRGRVTVRSALANSLNIPSVLIMEKVGVTAGIQTARDLGITSLEDSSDYGLPLVLGAAEVRLLELTNAYAAFANEGVYTPSKTVIEIKNKYDKVIDRERFGLFSLFDFSNSERPRTAVSREAAFIISSILSDARARASTFGSALGISRTAAVKTGTTENYRDALTVGYTPNIVVGVWVGNNDNTPMDNIAGSLGAAPIWRNLMNTFLVDLPLENFRKPPSIVTRTICLSGLATYSEFFISGTAPSSCNVVSPAPSPSPGQSPTPTQDDEPDDEPTGTPAPDPTLIPTIFSPTLLPTTASPTDDPAILPNI